jgi:PAS domain S-box-containing protein
VVPGGREARVVETLREAGGFVAESCPGLSEARRRLGDEAGVVVAESSSLTPSDLTQLAAESNAGPSWSDLPLIVVLDAHESAERLQELRAMPGDRANLMLLPHDVPAYTLISSVRFALRARQAQRDLAGQFSERLKLDDELRETREKFKILTENAPVAFGIVQGTRFVYANRFFAEFSGYSVDELLTLDFPALVHPSFREMMVDRARRRQAGEAVPNHYEFLAVTRDGEERWFDFSPAVIEYKGKPAIIGAGLDITERKRAEEALRWSEASLRLMTQSATRLLLADAPDEVLGSIFDAVATHIRADVFLFFLVTPDGSRLRLQARRGVDEATARSFQFIEWGQPFCGRAALERRSIVVSGIQGSCLADAAALKALGVDAYACHPLVDDQVLGAISFCARDRNQFANDELEIMRAVANQASMALARQRLNRTLEQRAVALEEADRTKDRFLAVLSHELRTPLAPVLAAVSLLQREPDQSEQTRRDLELIRRNVEMEARLIDDLLDVTRIAQGKVELDKRPLELSAVLQRAIEVCRPDIEASRLQFGFNCDSAPRIVLGDSGRLQQVFWNLLKNAVKFTPQGGCVGVVCYPDGQDHVVVEVHDSGVGLDPEAMPRIFDAFAQADRAVTRQFGGLGLGLAISKSLVELHGGTIEAFSEGQGRGSMFRVRWPVARAGDLTPTVSGSLPSRGLPQGTGPLRLLVVEDHGDMAEMMRVMLESEGHQVETAGDARTALQAACSGRFDMLISDLGLPGGSGLDLMRELRSRGITLPGIALSGYGQDKDLRESQAAGFSAHLVKPVDMERLFEAMDRIMQPVVTP